MENRHLDMQSRVIGALRRQHRTAAN